MTGLPFNWIVLIGILVAIVYRYVFGRFNHWRGFGVVSDKTHPLFGNVADFIFMRKSMGEIYRDLYFKFRSERFVGSYRITTKELVLTDLEDIKRVLITDFAHFKDRSDIAIEDREPLLAHLFNAKSDRWKSTRQTISPAFTTGKLRNMIPLILEVGDEFTRYLDEISRNEDETEFREVMARFTTDVIGSCGFGIKMNSMMDVNAPFRVAGREIFTPTFDKFIKFLIKRNTPSLYSMVKLKVYGQALEDFFTNVVRQMMEERKNSKTKRNDFIDLMLELKSKHESDQDDRLNIKIDEKYITTQAFIFFAAGFETSSTLMSFTLHELALNPDIQEKAYQEIQKVLKEHDGKMSYDIISEMTYLDMVVSEAQRKYPALGFLSRSCTKTYTFPGSKVQVEPGTLVEVPVFGIHYDPKYYPEPEKFIPERFLPEEKALRHPMAYLPFGDGPRNCVGIRLGKMQSIIGLIMVLKDFSVEPCSKTIPKVVFSPRSFITSSKNGIWLKLKRR